MSQEINIPELVDERYQKLQSDVLYHAMIVQSEVLRVSGEFLHQRGFIQIMPVIISPVTDPLRHFTGRAQVEYYGQVYQLTKSMIFHKRIALLAHERIFAFSPNIRLESADRAGTGRHLFEFSQLDLEVKGASRDEIMDLGEDLFIYTLGQVKERCAGQLGFFNRDLRVPARPFARVAYKDVFGQYGEDFENIVSQQHAEPVWVVDMCVEAREFYDREYPDRPGFLVDMDLLYPEGFGEALSGGEREYTLENILRRIKMTKVDLDNFKLYLEVSARGLPPSAGFGVGLERLTRFICGLPRVEDAVLFPKVPGKLSL
jgi:asparaginyl-tRNA synthetase